MTDPRHDDRNSDDGFSETERDPATAGLDASDLGAGPIPDADTATQAPDEDAPES